MATTNEKTWDERYAEFLRVYANRTCPRCGHTDAHRPNCEDPTNLQPPRHINIASEVR